MIFRDLIRRAHSVGASDLHLESEGAPVVRVRGELSSIGEPIVHRHVEQIGRSLMGEEGWSTFIKRGSADLSLDVEGRRCRINIFQTVRGIAIAARLLTGTSHDLRACNLHPDLRQLVEARNGLIVVSGPTGSGKSTTLAALIEEINASRARHIITLESPLEYLFSNRRSFIRQREIPTHSPTYEQAIIDALRENPDVLVIGEMRTPEVMRLTLNAAETGHLVLTTIHSATCAEALNRICMSFSAEIQGSIRAQLADCLVGVISQRLEYQAAVQLRIPHCEILVSTSATKGVVRSGQLSQLGNVIQSGGEDGMWSFDRYERWMMQKKDWILASTPNDASVQSIPRRTSKSPGAVTSQVIDAPYDLSIDEETDLAALARKLDERTR